MHRSPCNALVALIRGVSGEAFRNVLRSDYCLPPLHIVERSGSGKQICREEGKSSAGGDTLCALPCRALPSSLEIENNVKFGQECCIHRRRASKRDRHGDREIQRQRQITELHHPKLGLLHPWKMRRHLLSQAPRHLTMRSTQTRAWVQYLLASSLDHGGM